MFPVRQELIKQYIEMLVDGLGGIRKPVDLTEYSLLFKQEKFTEVVGLIRGQMKLPLKVRVGYVKSGGPEKAGAWINSNQLHSLPRYDTPEFSTAQVDLYTKKEELYLTSLEAVVYRFAHELSHVLLYAMRHPLCEVETATDLCVMVMGYGEALVKGREGVSYRHSFVMRQFLQFIGQPQAVYTWRLGYLSAEEAEYAIKYIRSLQ